MTESFLTETLSSTSPTGFIAVAIIGYFLMASVSVFDKYLLHSRISKPSVYAFYVAIFSSFAFLFIPIAYYFPSIGTFYFPGFKEVAMSIASGFFFIYGLVALYRAVQDNEISRVAPLVGTIIPFFSIIYAYLYLDEKMGPVGLLAVFILIAGGFLVSFDLPIRNLKLFKGFKYSVISAFCQAASFVLLKGVFDSEGGSFLNGFIWNRIGFFLAGLSILVVPIFRNQILNSFKAGKKSKKEATSTGLLFVVNKIMAGVGSFLIVFAISKGSVSSVNSVGSIQFAFILILVAILSIRNKHIFEEKLSFSDWMQKIFAIMFIGLGIWMLSLEGGELFKLLS